jgi:hypothetical protein
MSGLISIASFNRLWQRGELRQRFGRDVDRGHARLSGGLDAIVKPTA